MLEAKFFYRSIFNLYLVNGGELLLHWKSNVKNSVKWNFDKKYIPKYKQVIFKSWKSLYLTLNEIILFYTMNGH